MNTVVFVGKNCHEYEGSIWETKDELYIFAQVSLGKWAMISLIDGNRFYEQSEDFYEITEEFQLVTMEAEIAVKVS